MIPNLNYAMLIKILFYVKITNCLIFVSIFAFIKKIKTTSVSIEVDDGGHIDIIMLYMNDEFHIKTQPEIKSVDDFMYNVRV